METHIKDVECLMRNIGMCFWRSEEEKVTFDELHFRRLDVEAMSACKMCKKSISYLQCRDQQGGLHDLLKEFEDFKCIHAFNPKLHIFCFLA
jgi:hypothetical protein